MFSTSILVLCSLGHAALAVAHLLQAGPDPGEEDKFVGFESILSQFLSVCKCLPGEEDVSGDVDGVLGGLVVVVGLVIGPDAVGRDVPLEHHCSDLIKDLHQHFINFVNLQMAT